MGGDRNKDPSARADREALTVDEEGQTGFIEKEEVEQCFVWDSVKANQGEWTRGRWIKEIYQKKYLLITSHSQPNHQIQDFTSSQALIVCKCVLFIH